MVASVSPSSTNSRESTAAAKTPGIGHKPQGLDHAVRDGEVVWLTGIRGHQKAQAQPMRHLAADERVTRVTISSLWLGPAPQFGGLRSRAGGANESAPGGTRPLRICGFAQSKLTPACVERTEGSRLPESTHATDHLANSARRHYNGVNALCIHQQPPRLTILASLPPSVCIQHRPP